MLFCLVDVRQEGVDTGEDKRKANRSVGFFVPEQY